MRLLTELTTHAGNVSGDPARLQQVIWNLLTNAVKFTPRGGEVKVTLARLGPHVEIKVADTGEGIVAAFLPFVFDRFRQADGGITRRHGGLGLGLAIVKQLVELHGGSIRVESAGVGAGSSFVLTLPVRSLDGTSEPAPPLTLTGPSSRPAWAREAPDEPLLLTGLRVLVVDDEADARALLERLLRDCGAAVTLAASVDEALTLAARGALDAVVSDIAMPDQDGYALVRGLRALSGAQGSVPVVALTAYARRDDRVRAMRAGFQAHIAKPVDASELAAVLANVTGRFAQD